jgi:hypothetical protein
VTEKRVGMTGISLSRGCDRFEADYTASPYPRGVELVMPREFFAIRQMTERP